MAGRFQFNLRHVLFAFVYASVCLTLISWRLAAGLLVSIALAGIVCIVVGKRQNAPKLGAAGLTLACLTIVILLLDLFGPIMYWSGSYFIRSNISVCSSQSEKGVPYAKVSLLTRHIEVQSYLADSAGKLLLEHERRCGGKQSLFGILYPTQRRRSLQGFNLRIEAEGYLSKVIPLSAATGVKYSRSWDKQLPSITITLDKKSS